MLYMGSFLNRLLKQKILLNVCSSSYILLRLEEFANRRKIGKNEIHDIYETSLKKILLNNLSSLFLWIFLGEVGLGLSRIFFANLEAAVFLYNKFLSFDIIKIGFGSLSKSP